MVLQSGESHSTGARADVSVIAHIVQARALLNAGPAVLATVTQVQGSVPREVGAWMVIGVDQVINTIGGGHLEFDVIAQARQWLAQTASSPTTSLQAHEPLHESPTAGLTLRFALGPSLGQCCGGVVHLTLQRVQASDLVLLEQRWLAALQPFALFGGGHVGRALIHILGTLPFSVRWIDSRDEIFPEPCPINVTTEHSDPVHAAVLDLPAGAHVFIMSFSHAEDLDVVAACLKRQSERADLGMIGLIGSKTKWATFRRRLQERGFSQEALSQVVCPIGLPGITGKAPEVIAVAVAAQLLTLPATKH